MLVNDFGSVNIDAALIVGIEDNVVSLANGCTCCSLRDDLVATVIDTINRPERPELIVLEASGIADPGGITMAFTTPRLRDRIRLDSVTCVVDADSVFAHSEHPEVNQLKLLQIAFSDMVVLNKVDLAGPERVAAVRRWIDEHFNNIRVIETTFADVPTEILLSAGRLDPAAAPPDDHRDHPTFDTWTYDTDAALSLPLLEDALRRLPGTVFRCKGIVRSKEEPDRPSIVQVVCRRVDITPGEGWRAEPRTRLVVISAPGSVKADELAALVDSCVVG
ncbi:MAG: hypothetical protein QG597_3451 [Actinomycetota bacterium]|nr:hypothetical protein [Actinomycetota bacterium]